MKRLVLPIICVVLSATGSAFGEWWPIHVFPRAMLQVEITAIYDDNLFKYSNEDIEEFAAGKRPYRFPIETRDDMAVRGDIRLNLDLGRTRVELRHRGYQYFVNSIKSYQVFSGKLNQELGSHLNAELKYTFVPSYMVRHYLVPDSGPRVYLPCTFSEHVLRLGVALELGRFTFGTLGELGTFNYNTNFDHYDTEFWGTGGAISYTPNENFRVRFQYELRKNLAKGANILEMPDISNDRHTAWLSLRKKKFILPKLEIGLSFMYRLRVYTTDKPYSVDPLHSGREDSEWRGTVSTTFRVNPRLAIIARYALEVRTTTSPAKADIDEIKDYTKNVLLSGLRFTL